jgi:hypothetical protein
MTEFSNLPYGHVGTLVDNFDRPISEQGVTLFQCGEDRCLPEICEDMEGSKKIEW